MARRDSEGETESKKIKHEKDEKSDDDNIPVIIVVPSNDSDQSDSGVAGDNEDSDKDYQYTLDEYLFCKCDKFNDLFSKLNLEHSKKSQNKSEDKEKDGKQSKQVPKKHVNFTKTEVTETHEDDTSQNHCEAQGCVKEVFAACPNTECQIYLCWEHLENLDLTCKTHK